MGRGGGALARFGAGESVERLGRVGLIAKGVSFGIVGVLAVLLALGFRGAATDRPGAFRYLSQQPYGFVLLALLALGFGAYATWRFAQAFLDRDDEGKGMKGWAKRAGAFGKGVFYMGLSLLTVSFLTGPRGESASEPERTARVFEWPLGRWLVAALGAGFVGYGLWNGFRSISGKFRKRMKKRQMDRENTGLLVNVAGFLGHLARMVLFCMVGAFLVRASYRYDAKEAIGLDGALAKLAQQPAGPLWLAAAAVGLFAYGVFSVLQARYRDI